MRLHQHGRHGRGDRRYEHAADQQPIVPLRAHAAARHLLAQVLVHRADGARLRVHAQHLRGRALAGILGVAHKLQRFGVCANPQRAVGANLDVVDIGEADLERVAAEIFSK